ncbi:ABC transporter transmembrane domain-containing protein [Rhodovibrionaceae bacterium A322]
MASKQQPQGNNDVRGLGRDPSRNIQVLSYLWQFLRPYRLQILGALTALVVAASTVLVLGFGLRKLVDEGFSGNDSQLLDQAVLGLVGVVLVLAIATYSRYFLVSWLGERVVADIRQAVYSQVLKLSPAYFETTRTGEILSRLTSDTTVLQVVIGSQASVALRNILMFVGGMVLLIITSPKLTGLVFLGVPVVVLPIVIFGRKVRRLSKDSQDRIADVGAYVEESLGAIRTVQAFNHEDEDRRRFGNRVEEAFDTAVARIRARALLTALVIGLVFGAVSAILWSGGHDVLSGRISAGELSAFVFYAIVVAGSLGSLSEVYGDLQRAAGATERLSDLLTTEPDIAAPAAPLALPSPAQGDISFDQVVFHYPARPDQPTLSGFDLSARPGEKIALVGPSGAGKSTVFQLLLRFYDPEAGRITLDGVELREADPEVLRQRFGLVAQEPVIFSENARENIRYGRPTASDEEVIEAARLASCLEFIEALPEGFDTFLGEKGVRLSGGQRQRLAIARAILRDPTVLLLDEATSALDAESEKLVQDALDGLMEGRTTIMIAHRLATVLKADRILVIDHGQVVAQGTHQELIADPGSLYARLAKLQFDQRVSNEGPRAAE